jgi:hypothetical protein
LIDHLTAGERDAEQEELRGLIAYCHERVDLLNSSDADFIVSMKRIVERYAVTPRQFGTLVLLSQKVAAFADEESSIWQT